MKTPFFFLSILLLTLSCSTDAAVDEMTGLVGDPRGDSRPSATDPSQGPEEQALGFYSRGNLKFANLLPTEGFGFVHLFRPRDRGHGTYDLIYVITESARRLQELFPSRDRVQVGDLSAFEGGPISRHASHQNGLDVDIAFLRKDQTEQDPNDTSGFRESFVQRGKLTANFDIARNWAFAKLLISTGRVQRVFVNNVVKRGLCAFAKANGELDSQTETLRRLRVYTGHMDHFHVRVTCPDNSPACQSQNEVPEGSGC
jgi:penicillin-insensitive murein endopeptidase